MYGAWENGGGDDSFLKLLFMKKEFKYAHIAFQTEGEVSAIFYSVGYPEMPMAVDLENFMVNVRTNETIGLIGKSFEVALLNIKEDEAAMKLLNLNKESVCN